MERPEWNLRRFQLSIILLDDKGHYEVWLRIRAKGINSTQVASIVAKSDTPSTSGSFNSSTKNHSTTLRNAFTKAILGKIMFINETKFKF